MIENAANKPTGSRKEMYTEIKSVRDQLTALNPDYEDAIELLTKSFLSFQ
jgi:hypothetical protein